TALGMTVASNHSPLVKWRGKRAATVCPRSRSALPFPSATTAGQGPAPLKPKARTAGRKGLRYEGKGRRLQKRQSALP
ncbi:MAG TPA: hypothetical protein VJV96_11595, partial [Candidatus Angelobacter sp.]|nr:hypothetical protein [Candidatus Angelobacter sp.]